jgi:FixJ family two-component response regulator
MTILGLSSVLVLVLAKKMPEIISEQFNRFPVIFITAFGAAVWQKAYNYISKPFHKEHILPSVSPAFNKQRMILKNKKLKDRLQESLR